MRTSLISQSGVAGSLISTSHDLQEKPTGSTEALQKNPLSPDGVKLARTNERRGTSKSLEENPESHLFYENGRIAKVALDLQPLIYTSEICGLFFLNGHEFQK